MPRTKKSTRKTASSHSNESGMARIHRVASSGSSQDSAFFDDCATSTPKKSNRNRKAQLRQFIKEGKQDLKCFQNMFLSDIEEFEKSCMMMKMSIPVEYLHISLKYFKRYREEDANEPIDIPESEIKENANPNKSHSDSTKKFKKPDGVLLPRSEKESKKQSSKFKTPINTISYSQVTTITPKVNMNRPLSVLRHPRIGEQAVSMDGSPILVSAVPREDVATVSVPLNDGRVVTILPTVEFQREQMPTLDEDVKSQLETLYKNLASFFSSDDSTDDTSGDI